MWGWMILHSIIPTKCIHIQLWLCIDGCVQMLVLLVNSNTCIIELSKHNTCHFSCISMLPNMEFFVQSRGLHDITFSLNNDYHDLWWMMKVPLHDSAHVEKGKQYNVSIQVTIVERSVFLWIRQACCDYIMSDSLLFHVKSLKLILASLITFFSCKFLLNTCCSSVHTSRSASSFQHFVITFECRNPQVPDLIGCYRQPVKCSGAGLGIPFCTCMHMAP